MIQVTPVYEDGHPVFPPRSVDVVPIRFSDRERELYRAVTSYVANEYNLASEQKNRTVGFAMVILQKRMVSSIAAIRKSLRRRLANLISSRETVLSREEDVLGFQQAGLVVADLHGWYDLSRYSSTSRQMVFVLTRA